MYIRETTHKNKKNDQTYSTYKLVESIRTERGPRQRVILNLGTKLDLPKEEWGDLANRIEEIIRGIKPLLPYREEVELLAQIFSKLALKKKSRSLPSEEPEKALPVEADYQQVDLNSLKHMQVRTVGAEYLMLNELNKFGLMPELQRLGFRDSEIQTAVGSLVSRAVHPGSERRSLAFLQNKSALGDLLERDFGKISLTRMYQISDRLLGKKKEIETFFYERESKRFQLTETIILYDLTNTYFEGGTALNPKAERGRSKEKRSDCPLVTLALVLDEEGFCKRSEIFSGNVTESKTLLFLIEELKTPDELSRPIVVMDAGLSTEENLEALRKKESRFDYVVVSRKAKKAFPDEGEIVTLSEKVGNHVRGVAVKNEETDEIELYCHSEAREKKERSIKTLFQTRFEEDLKHIEAGFSVKGRMKNYEKVIEKIGRLKEKYSKVSGLYEITVKKQVRGENAESLRWEIRKDKEQNKLQGNYCLRTNIKGFDEGRLWKIYMTLTEVEAAFRSMKSELGMRPVYHHKEHRVDGHLFITVLAYHLVHSLRFQLKKQGIHHCWDTIREAMSTQTRGTTQLKKDDQKMVSIRKSSEPESYHQQIYRALKISAYPGKVEKTIL